MIHPALVPNIGTDPFLAELTLLLSPLEVETEAKQAAKFRRRNQRATPASPVLVCLTTYLLITC